MKYFLRLSDGFNLADVEPFLPFKGVTFDAGALTDVEVEGDDGEAACPGACLHEGIDSCG